LGLKGKRQQENGGYFITRSIVSFTAHQILFGSHVKKNEMGGAFVTYGERSEYKIFVGEMRGKEALVRPRLRW
jgi:hypothetical protein